MARVVSVLIGQDRLPGTTVTRYCASSAQDARMAFHAIKSGEGTAYVAAGVESVSSYVNGCSDRFPPHLQDDALDWKKPVFGAARARSAERAAAGAPVWSNPRDVGLMPDAYIAMGQTAENVAALHGVSRADQDAFAVRSQNRADRAVSDGFFAREISPVTTPEGTVVDADDGPRNGVTLEALAALKPVFRPAGTITAGNCCPLNDGAAALVIMSSDRAADLGIPPLARIVSTGVTGLPPEIMGLGPVEASRSALARAGMRITDVDLVEINEAFAAQVIPSAQMLGVDEERLNVRGGAIALGHPYGMTGARITTTLLNGLTSLDKPVGLLTMCGGRPRDGHDH